MPVFSSEHTRRTNTLTTAGLMGFNSSLCFPGSICLLMSVEQWHCFTSGRGRRLSFKPVTQGTLKERDNYQNLKCLRKDLICFHSSNKYAEMQMFIRIRYST